MQFGVHLPLIDLDDAPRTLDRLSTYARRAAALDFRFLCANDHLVFRRPWLDGPTALAAVLGASGSMTIATTVALPVVRGPAQTAKLLAALETLSGGRLLAGVGPGSSTGDYLAAGVPFAERWGRFDEASAALRTWEHEGRIRHRETIFEGVESCVDALNGLFTGANIGKMLVKLSEPTTA